jgi:very-short-patch-repair endonuclease
MTNSEDARVESKIEHWKAKLLDFGKRNRLLNYRYTKRSDLQIFTPGIYELWDSFVEKEQPLVFPFVEENNFFDDENEESEIVDEAEFFSSLKTNQSIKDMQKTLRTVKGRAKTAIEEQGINFLYLSFGFLKWREKEDAKTGYSSPLILVPVALEQESIVSPFKLSLHEDEVVLNPTLVAMVKNDFGIDLPKYSDGDDLLAYIDSLSELPLEKLNWEIEQNVALGLLSFLKINMFNDISKHSNEIVSNSIVRAICGETAAASFLGSSLEGVAGYNHDLDRPDTIFQVIDADSSQLDAILCAKRGVSFVLQGPPGTGKSQTISNIISERLADGKKVLFVSEKMAALEVVKTRLEKAGLGDFCLTLHSHKAHKKEILNQFETTLCLAGQRQQLKNDAYAKLNQLEQDRSKLNAYANAIHTNIEPFNRTIFEVNGELSKLTEYNDIVFSFDNIDTVPSRGFDELSYFLTEFANCIDRQNGTKDNNPWGDTKIDFVTHELRHDINSKADNLLPKIGSLKELLEQFSATLLINMPLSYAFLYGLVETLNIVKHTNNIPVTWITRIELEPRFDEINDCEALKLRFLQCQKSLTECYQSILFIDASIQLSDPYQLNNTHNISTEIEKLNTYVSRHPQFSKWNSLEYSRYEQLKLMSEQLKDLKKTIADDFEDSIYSVDFNGIDLRYKTEYPSFTKIFKKSYKEDKKEIRRHYKTIVKQIDDSVVLDIISKLKSISELSTWFFDNKTYFDYYFGELYRGEYTDFALVDRTINLYNLLARAISISKELASITEDSVSRENQLNAHFEFMYEGMNTEWSAIRESLAWAVKFRNDVLQKQYPLSFIKMVCENSMDATEYDSMQDSLIVSMNQIKDDFYWYLSLFNSPELILGLPFDELIGWIQSCKNNLSALEQWIDYRSARNKCANAGLGEYVNQVEIEKIPPNEIVPIFQKRFYRLWLDRVAERYPEVQHFRRHNQEDTMKEFGELDKLQFEIAKQRVLANLINSLPATQHLTSGGDEVSVLRRELKKSRKIKPIRLLFKEIPNLITRLKPCLMMSPLSVSVFLESDSFIFDTVIFDEASQVLTENAIGAISRGKQVVIAGDSKQLPPTSFFSAGLTDSEYDEDSEEYNDEGAFESLLDEASLLPEQTLLWHYRSRHEHLIAFSNAKIYRNRLITFPSCEDRTPDNGVEYIYLQDGYYEGSKKGNIVEAQKVAELVFEHLSKYPHRSLGVIAFGINQAYVIDAAIRKMRMENQECEWFFNEENPEPFFVKNLESVQGDERDTIIFSIGYAKNRYGKMLMHFGPLSNAGGERRLNVAITRAKHNVKLVGSILPTDIIVEKIQSEGAKLLRSYIEFAMRGPEVLDTEIDDDFSIQHDSPFEQSVFDFLDRRGYKVATQVGCSGFRIDLAIKHPELSGRYVLGIECDGATYHSARTARERDRLRQDVLENMGWKIYRIWSTDWIKDPITERQMLIDAVEHSLGNYEEVLPGELSKDESLLSEELDFLETEVSDAQVDLSNPYGFVEYVAPEFLSYPLSGVGILDVIKKHYPLHIEQLYQLCAPSLRREKATKVVKDEVDRQLHYLRHQYVKDNEFLFPVGQCYLIPKIGGDRLSKHISCFEFAAAMKAISGHAVGMTKEGLITETARAYGFARTGSMLQSILEEAFNYALKNQYFEVADNKVIAN